MFDNFTDFQKIIIKNLLFLAVATLLIFVIVFMAEEKPTTPSNTTNSSL